MKEKEILPEGFKRCSKCGEVKGVGEYSRDKSKRDGLCYYCKICNNEYYKSNKEKIIEYSKVWAKNNREKVAENLRNFNKKNKEKRHRYNKMYFKNNKEKEVARVKIYRKNNKEKINNQDHRIRILLSYSGIPPVYITTDLIACKRQILQVKRLNKQLNKKNEER